MSSNYLEIDKIIYDQGAPQNYTDQHLTPLQPITKNIVEGLTPLTPTATAAAAPKPFVGQQQTAYESTIPHFYSAQSTPISDMQTSRFVGNKPLPGRVETRQSVITPLPEPIRYRPHRISTIMDNTVCGGNIISRTYAPNQINCRNTCLHDNLCDGWTFNKKYRFCDQRRPMGTCNRNRDFISGKIIGQGPLPPVPPIRVRNSSILPNTNFPSQSYRTINTPNVTACKNNCIADNRCKQWTYDGDAGVCFMKNTITSPMPRARLTSGQIFV